MTLVVEVLAIVNLGVFGYSDSGIWANVYSGSWALATLWCAGICASTLVLRRIVLLIEAEIWSKTLQEVNPPSKKRDQVRGTRSTETNKVVNEGKYNRQYWVDSSRIGD